MSSSCPRMGLLHVQEEVLDAMAAGRGVVALESTILAHGLPQPDNVEVAARIEQAVRDGGAVPATIALLDGKVHIGLTLQEVERVCSDPGIGKLSVRDLGVAAALGRSGATTVASTTALAHLAGIRVMATGGLGGVHRGTSTYDVSADLGVIASTPVVVVCGGVTSIHDVPATLESLETLSVPVLGYRTDAFAGFLLSDSGSPVPWRVDSAEAAARVVLLRDALATDHAGVVLANPLPEDRQVDRTLHDRLVADGLALLEREGVTGKDVTARLLEYVHENSGGESLRANVELVLANARLAGEVAEQIERLR